MTWQRSTTTCSDCGGRADARTDQWGAVVEYECVECGATQEADRDGR